MTRLGAAAESPVGGRGGAGRSLTLTFSMTYPVAAEMCGHVQVPLPVFRGQHEEQQAERHPKRLEAQPVSQEGAGGLGQHGSPGSPGAWTKTLPSRQSTPSGGSGTGVVEMWPLHAVAQASQEYSAKFPGRSDREQGAILSWVLEGVFGHSSSS